MTTHSRPITDYKKNSILENCYQQYQNLNLELMEIICKLYSYLLSDNEIDELNNKVDSIMTEIDILSNTISKYYER